MLFYISLMSLGAILYDIGFVKELSGSYLVNSIYVVCLGFYLLGLIYKKKMITQIIKGEQFRLFDYIWFLLITFLTITRVACFFNPNYQATALVNILTHISVVAIFVIELSRITKDINANRLPPSLIFVFTFVLLILSGAGLLCLPNATTHINGSQITFIDAVFTSTSAVCVTGLAVQDTQLFFTPLGHFIILLLIQLGGLGVMTFTSFFGFFMMGGQTFKSQLLVKEMVNANQIGEVFRTLMKILLITFGIEFLGAVWIYFSLDATVFPDFGYRVWFAVFHSISAFCNAGFSILSLGLYDPSMQYNYSIHLCICLLITLGGIGFPIVFNFYSYLRQMLSFRIANKKNQLNLINPSLLLSPNTKIVMLVSSILIVFGTIAFWIFEYNNTLTAHTTIWGQFVTSLFGSITPRTAGFNTIDYAQLTVPTIMITLFLMWVGASPASTGGGIKTTVLAIGTLNIFNIARGKERIEIFQREISESSIKKAFAIICLSLIILGLCTILVYSFEFQGHNISAETDRNRDLTFIAFECFSAFGTVGLSMGLTPTLTDGSKIVLIVAMFLGRVGMLTLIIGLLRQVSPVNIRYPKDDLMT
jgi:trk system potassium uptake protein